MQTTSRLARRLAGRTGAALILAACAASAQATTVFGYVDAADWAAGVSGFIQGWAVGQPAEQPGRVVDWRSGNIGIPTPTPIINGHYRVQADSVACANLVMLGLPCPTESTFSFMTPITAFGIDLDVLAGGIGDGVSFLVNFLDGTSMEVGTYRHDDTGDVAGTSHGFFGFTSDTPVTLIQLITNSTAGIFTAHETADVSRFQYVYRQDGGGGGTVPEPASFALALLGLAATGALARKPR